VDAAAVPPTNLMKSRRLMGLLAGRGSNLTTLIGMCSLMK
jgi:hypothetical protein